MVQVLFLAVHLDRFRWCQCFDDGIIYSVCTVALTVAKSSSHYDRFAISVPARSALVRPRLAIWGHKRPQGAAGHKRNWGHIRQPKGSGTLRHQPFGRQYGVGHMGDKSVDQMGWSNWSINIYLKRLAYLLYGSVASLPSPSSNIEAMRRTFGVYNICTCSHWN